MTGEYARIPNLKTGSVEVMGSSPIGSTIVSLCIARDSRLLVVE